MKTFISSQRKNIAGIAILLSALVLVSCKKDAVTPVNNSPYSISGNANGGQVIPSVADTGTATISGTFNPANNLLTYSTYWNNLTGAPTAGGFYSGVSGVSGTTVGNMWSFDSTATATGSRSDTLTLTGDQVNQLLNGNLYYSYSTVTNPAGEIRGQITSTR